jgi:radical SAM superfamily enzyme YgiQ (UPF0313 family)
MKVSLVQAPYWSIYTPPYALALLTGNLRSKGIPTTQRAFDIEFYRSVSAEEQALWRDENASFWATWYGEESRTRVQRMIADHSATVDRMVDQILSDEPDVVGFSVKMWSHWFSLAMAERLKRQAPEVYVIFGGPQASDASLALDQHPFIDALCQREADISLPRFLQAMERNGMQPSAEPGFVFRDPAGKIVDCGPIEQLPTAVDIPMADYSDYDFEQYLHPNEITLMLSRGCINRCSYCSESPAFRRFRAMPGEMLFAELVYHWERTNCRRPMKLLLNDSLINGNMRELERLAELLIEHRDTIQVEYGGMMFLRDELTDEVIDKLVRAGLKNVLFGLESGSEAVLKQMRKRFSLATAERVFQGFHERGVEVVASVIFGHPGETEAEFHRSLNFLRANAHNVDRFLLNYLGLYENSALTEHPEHYGIDPTTICPNGWVAEEGRNTFEVRAMRTNLARLALGKKVADIGGFVAQDRAMYDPVQPYREEIDTLKQQLADYDELRKRTLPPLNLVPLAPDQELGWMDSVVEVEPGLWRAKGWARDAYEDRAAQEVVVYNQRGRRVAYCRVTIDRVDVMKSKGNPRLRNCGWKAFFRSEDLDVGENVLRAYVVCPKGEDAFELLREAHFVVHRGAAAAPAKPAPERVMRMEIVRSEPAPRGVPAREVESVQA